MKLTKLALIALLGILLVPGIACGEEQKTETTPKWNCRQKVTIAGSPDGDMTNYQLKLYAGYTTTYTPELFIDETGIMDEITVYATYNGTLYWGHNYMDDGIGYVYKTVLATGVTSTIYSADNGLEAWQGVRVGTKIYIVGNEGDVTHIQRACVLIVDTADDNVTNVDHMSTGNYNEFTGVDTDGTYLYVGERGGGFWKIPIATITDTDTWERTWEDPNNWYCSTVAYFGGKVYSFLTDYSAFRVVSSPTDDLVNWTDELNYSTQTTVFCWDGQLVKCGNSLAVLAVEATSGNYYLFVFDGTSWTSHDLGIAAYTGGSVDISGYWLEEISQIVMMAGQTDYTSGGFYVAYLLPLDGASSVSIGASSGYIHISQSNQGVQTDYNGSIFFASTLFGDRGVYKLAANSTSTGNCLALNGKCRTDFGDIRFAKDDGTLLDYYLRDYSTGGMAEFWVEIDSIPSTGITIYAYYNNPAAATTSSGEDTFIFFEDFSRDLSKWSIAEGGDWSIVNGQLIGNDPGAVGAAIYSDSPVAVPASGYRIYLEKMVYTNYVSVPCAGLSPTKDIIEDAVSYYALVHETAWGYGTGSWGWDAVGGGWWPITSLGNMPSVGAPISMTKTSDGDFVVYEDGALVLLANDVTVVDTGGNWYIRVGLQSGWGGSGTFGTIWLANFTANEPSFDTWSDEEVNEEQYHGW